MALAGLAIGVVEAIAGGSIIRGFLFGVGTTDAITYAAVIVLLGSVALLASYLPARRAMRVDPVVALGAD